MDSRFAADIKINILQVGGTDRSGDRLPDFRDGKRGGIGVGVDIHYQIDPGDCPIVGEIGRFQPVHKRTIDVQPELITQVRQRVREVIAQFLQPGYDFSQFGQFGGTKLTA